MFWDSRIDSEFKKIWRFLDRFCCKVKSCLGISAQGNANLLLNQQGNWVNSSSFQYEIGQYVPSQGGVIAYRWLSTSPFGSPTSGSIQNYLVIDTADLSTSASWATINVNIPNVESTWNGSANTANMISAGAGSGITAGTAADLCNASTNNGKSDWYLPALDELCKVYENKWDIAQGMINAGGAQLSSAYYWSSTENDKDTSWAFILANGPAYYLSGKISYYSVRAMRKFSI